MRFRSRPRWHRRISPAAPEQPESRLTGSIRVCALYVAAGAALRLRQAGSDDITAGTPSAVGRSAHHDALETRLAALMARQRGACSCARGRWQRTRQRRAGQHPRYPSSRRAANAGSSGSQGAHWRSAVILYPDDPAAVQARGAAQQQLLYGDGPECAPRQRAQSGPGVKV